MKATNYLAAGFAAVLVTGAAQAASYNFSYTFDGTNITQDVGSDTADGINLMVGDDFTLTVKAAGDDFWNVLNAYSEFVPMSFLVTPGNDRTATIDTRWRLDGVEQDSRLDNGVVQSNNHVGAQNWDLAAGLMFDEITMAWSFDAIGAPGDSIIQETADVFEGFGDDVFFRSDDIEYVENMNVVPLPASLPLLAFAFGAMGIASRRRRTA